MTLHAVKSLFLPPAVINCSFYCIQQQQRCLCLELSWLSPLRRDCSLGTSVIDDSIFSCGGLSMRNTFSHLYVFYMYSLLLWYTHTLYKIVYLSLMSVLVNVFSECKFSRTQLPPPCCLVVWSDAPHVPDTLCVFTQHAPHRGASNVKG